MKKRKIFLVKVGIAILIMCSLIILYLFFLRTDTIKLTWMPVPDVQKQIDVFVEMGYCKEGVVSEDNTYAEIELSLWQRKKWKEYLYNTITDFIERANEIKHMKFQVSSDIKEMTIYADKEVNFQTLATYLGIIAWDIEMIQILNGEEEWGFNFVVKDMKTEKVLYNAFCPPGKMKVYESMWDNIEE